MVNRLYEKRSYAVIIAATVVTFVVLVGGLVSGLVCALRSRVVAEEDNEYARHILLDAADGMSRSLSAMRLVNESEPAEELAKTALVFTVRAEAALECLHGEWSGDRAKEAFLNDLAVALHTRDALETAEKAQMLYEYSVKFAASVADGSEFEYGGEIEGGGDNDDTAEPPTPEQIEKAGEMVATALDCETHYIGTWDGRLEFNIQRDGDGGYAVVCGDKIEQFSFSRSGDGETSIEEAARVAVESAKACGYDGLTVRYCDKVGGSVAVIMCREIDGALAVDDFASAVVFGGRTVAFSAGGCDKSHDGAPKPKVSEGEARKASGGAGEGRLVVRTVNGRERICYEYRFDLDDGAHYVYVCAETGKQMQVK